MLKRLRATLEFASEDYPGVLVAAVEPNSRIQAVTVYRRSARVLGAVDLDLESTPRAARLSGLLPTALTVVSFL